MNGMNYTFHYMYVYIYCINICGHTHFFNVFEGLWGNYWGIEVAWVGIRRLRAAFFISVCLFLCTENLRGMFADTATDLEVLLL